MSNATVTYLVAGGCGALALGAYVGLILAPAWTSYSAVWQRLAAAFLTVYVLVAVVGLGALAGAGVVWFWDSLN